MGYWFKFFHLFLQKFLNNAEVLLRKLLPKIDCGLHTACEHLLEVCIAVGGKIQHVIWFLSSVRMIMSNQQIWAFGVEKKSSAEIQRCDLVNGLLIYIYLGIWALTQCFFQVVFPEQWRNGSLSNNFKVSKCNELFSKAKLHLFSGKWSKGGEIVFFSDMWKEREVKESYHFSKIYVYTVSWSTWFSRKNKAICVALPLQITMVEEQLRLCTGFMLC